MQYIHDWWWSVSHLWAESSPSERSPLRVMSSENFRSLRDWWLEVQLLVYRENAALEQADLWPPAVFTVRTKVSVPLTRMSNNTVCGKLKNTNIQHKRCYGLFFFEAKSRCLSDSWATTAPHPRTLCTISCKTCQLPTKTSERWWKLTESNSGARFASTIPSDHSMVILSMYNLYQNHNRSIYVTV